MKHRYAFYWIILLVLLLAFEFVEAQESKSKHSLGINAGLSFNERWTSENLIYNYSLTASFGKHFVFAGPLLVKINYMTDLKTWPGIQAGYQFYPFSRDKFVSPFVGLDVNYVSLKESHEGKIICEFCNYNYQSSTSSTKQLDNFISLGFQMRPCRIVYFNGSVGFGYQWNKTKENIVYDKQSTYHSNSGITFNNLAGLYFRGGIGIDLIYLSVNKKDPKK